jgi:hypothetical protein
MGVFKPGFRCSMWSGTICWTSVSPALQPSTLADRKLLAECAFVEAAVKLRCDNCHHEIKQTPIIEARKKFCDGRCGDHWKRRMLRLQAAQKPALQ